jgi:hypothetical protein
LQRPSGEVLDVNLRCAAGWMVFCLPAIANPIGPKPDTLQAWDDYIQHVVRAEPTAGVGHQFLWLDRDPQRAERVRRGEVLAASETGANPHAVPHALIHHWVGAVFIPGATLAQVFAVAEDYGRYKEFYKPGVLDAALVCRIGSGEDEERFRVRYAQKFLFTSAVLDTEYQIRHVQLDARRWYSIAHSTRLQESADQAKSWEIVSASDAGSRYIWRIYFVSRYEQRDGGVYVEQENIVLSRGIPTSLRWLVEPAVRQLSRDVVVAYLRATRDAVRSGSGTPNPAGKYSQ